MPNAPSSSSSGGVQSNGTHASTTASEGYQSLSALQPALSSSTSHNNNAHGFDGSSNQNSRYSAGSIMASPGKMLAKGRDLFTASTSNGTTPAGVPKRADYGSMGNPQQSNSAIAEEDEYDEDDYVEEEVWGNFRLILLTAGLAGAQLTWTLELGYGTPYLLSLGLTKELTSLVWLAGPVSGFIVQPIIGALSDNSSSKYRRRRWVVYATVLIVIATLILAFASELATWIVNLLNIGEGDWDPTRIRHIRLIAIGFAVGAFYVLDFSLNGIQAALRALVLDMVPSDQQTAANAYLARMTNWGNIAGYGLGYLNLSATWGLKWIGGGQFRKLCILAIFVLVFAVTVTCATQHEERKPKVKRKKDLMSTFYNIARAVRDLPIPIRRICYVQLFAWSGFFPVMFYSTTWVGVRYFLENPADPPTNDEATRAGSASLLYQSIIAVATSTILPAFQAAGASNYVLDKPPGKFWNFIRWNLSWWTPRNLWTFSHIFFVAVMSTTFAAKTKDQATAIIALLGVSWAITCWIPFAILMEFIRELEAGAELNAEEVISAAEVMSIRSGASRRPDASHLSVPGPGSGFRGGRRSSRSSRRRPSSVRSGRSGRARAGKALSDCEPLLPGDRDAEAQPEQKEAVGGTILGIHNLAIVSPQFITALVASVIFKISEVTEHSPVRRKYGIESGADVVWILRFGGLMTIFAIFISRWVPAPPSEVTYIENLRDSSMGDREYEDE